MTTIIYWSLLQVNATSLRSARAPLATPATHLFFPLLVTGLSIVAAIGACGCNDAASVSPTAKAALAAPLAPYEIVGFYGAANSSGTFVRTIEQAPIEVGDAVLVTGTGLYDGTWTVLQKVAHQEARDPQPLWGYRIAAKWQGFPPEFLNDGGSAVRNVAKLQAQPAP